MKPIPIAVATLLSFSTLTSAHAITTGFVLNPTGNSANWAAHVTAQGATISELDFDSHPLGDLQGDFYSASHGVTLNPSGDVNEVRFGTGPGQNNSLPPLSSGEGPHAESNYLFDGPLPSSLIISFDTPVIGAGLFVIDYFNPVSSNPLVLEAYSGANGSGALLGTFSSVGFNFQPDNLYFMGIASDSHDIRSVVFRDVNAATGDTIGIDNIRFARVTSVPEGGSALALFGFGLAGLAMLRKRIAE